MCGGGECDANALSVTLTARRSRWYHLYHRSWTEAKSWPLPSLCPETGTLNHNSCSFLGILWPHNCYNQRSRRTDYRETSITYHHNSDTSLVPSYLIFFVKELKPGFPELFPDHGGKHGITFTGSPCGDTNKHSKFKIPSPLVSL